MQVDQIYEQGGAKQLCEMCVIRPDVGAEIMTSTSMTMINSSMWK